ncbi:MAG: DUF2946 family protein [Phycisphaerales bacterium]|nr:DUF2946 family protein [Phycisphaerales bacterium]
MPAKGRPEDRVNAQQRSRGGPQRRQRRRRGLGLFVALGLAAILSSALVPLLHRNHTHGRSVDSIAAAHSTHGDGCAAGAPAGDHHAPAPAPPERDDESSCLICVFVKSSQSRGMILPPASQAPALRPPVSAIPDAPERSPRSSEGPATVSPRAPPRSIA